MLKFVTCHFSLFSLFFLPINLGNPIQEVIWNRRQIVHESLPIFPLFINTFFDRHLYVMWDSVEDEGFHYLFEVVWRIVGILNQSQQHLFCLLEKIAKWCDRKTRKRYEKVRVWCKYYEMQWLYVWCVGDVWMDNVTWKRGECSSKNVA